MSSHFQHLHPRKQFVDQLEQQLLDVYQSQQRPHFSWRWLVMPGFAVATLMLVVMQYGMPVVPNRDSQLAPSPTQPAAATPTSQAVDPLPSSVTTQPTQTIEPKAASLPTVPVKTADPSLVQFAQELAALESQLDGDSDLDNAISFTQL